MTIQWFPGHMAKARRQVTEKLKLVDIVIELVDARIPLSSRNPMIEEIIGQKPRLVLLNKADMADPNRTSNGLPISKSRESRPLQSMPRQEKGFKRSFNAAKEILKEKFDRMKSRGMRPACHQGDDRRDSERREVDPHQPPCKEEYSQNREYTGRDKSSAMDQSR